MKPNPPSELANYRSDQELSHSPLPVRVLGWLALVVFAVAVYSTFFVSGEQMILMCYVSYGGFLLLFSAYVIGKIMTRHTRCDRCRQVMDVIDVPWTAEQWQQIQGYELVGGLTGADGCLYAVEKTQKSGYTPYWSIWVQLQQWCVCHQCRVYVLKAQHSRKMLFSTRSDDEFEQAKQLLLTETSARENMEAAYEQRFQERLKKKEE